MKLYKAKLSTEIVFVSKDGYNEPLEILQHYVEKEICNNHCLTLETIDEIFDIKDIPPDWQDGRPYGLLPAEKTCLELIPLFRKAEKLKILEQLKKQKETLEKDIQEVEQELETL